MILFTCYFYFDGFSLSDGLLKFLLACVILGEGNLCFYFIFRYFVFVIIHFLIDLFLCVYMFV